MFHSELRPQITLWFCFDLCNMLLLQVFVRHIMCYISNISDISLVNRGKYYRLLALAYLLVNTEHSHELTSPLEVHRRDH